MLTWSTGADVFTFFSGYYLREPKSKRMRDAGRQFLINIVWNGLTEYVVRGQTEGEGSPHLPLMCDGHNWAADFFCLCWTFKQSTVKEINLFLPARVSLIFLSPAFRLPFLFMTLSPLFLCLCWLSLVLSPPPPLVSPFPSPPSLYSKGRFRGHQLLREGWESCMGSALGAAMLHYHQGDCRYAAATGCRHNNLKPPLQHRAV